MSSSPAKSRRRPPPRPLPALRRRSRPGRAGNRDPARSRRRPSLRRRPHERCPSCGERIFGVEASRLFDAVSSSTVGRAPRRPTSGDRTSPPEPRSRSRASPIPIPSPSPIPSSLLPLLSTSSHPRTLHAEENNRERRARGPNEVHPEDLGEDRSQSQGPAARKAAGGPRLRRYSPPARARTDPRSASRRPASRPRRRTMRGRPGPRTLRGRGLQPRSASWEPGNIPGLDDWRTRLRAAAAASSPSPPSSLSFSAPSEPTSTSASAATRLARRPAPVRLRSARSRRRRPGRRRRRRRPRRAARPARRRCPRDRASIGHRRRRGRPRRAVPTAEAPDAEPAAVDGPAPDAASSSRRPSRPDCGDEPAGPRPLALPRPRRRSREAAPRDRLRPGNPRPAAPVGQVDARTGLSRDRTLASEAADALGAATEANPDHGQLWFHYTDLLFKAGRRDEALAARTHCQSIRPANEYVASCRFLPE